MDTELPPDAAAPPGGPRRLSGRDLLVVFAGALIVVPAVCAALGALIAVMQDCDDAGGLPALIAGLVAAAGLEVWWVRARRAPRWWAAAAGVLGGAAAAIACAFAWFLVGFDRCFTF